MAGEWCEAQKRLLIEESNAWFDRHGLKVQLLRLPLPLPRNCSSWSDVAAEIEQHPLHLKLLNHQRLLAKRMRGNWSYSASSKSTTNDPRNKHLPFKLQPLPRALAAELPHLSRELLHEEFDGLLLTVQSKEMRPGTLPKAPVRSAIGVSKVFAGCVIESLASNERQLRALWVNRRLSARSTKLLLQVLLPRAVVEAFALEGFTYTPIAIQQQQQQHQQQRVQSFKSVFIDRKDLDLWPRQCWMLLPALKNFGWPLHYDIKGKAAAVHLDAGVSGSLTCSCHLTKTCLSASEQATVDRFLMVTEPLVHLLLPLRSERCSLSIDKHPLFSQRHGLASASPSPRGVKSRHSKGGKGGQGGAGAPDAPSGGERKGWREFISSQLDDELAREAACLVAGAPYTPRSGLCSTDDEWCGLTSEDVMHLVSDCEGVVEEPPRGVCTAQHSVIPQAQTKPSTGTRQCRQVGQKQAQVKRSLAASSARSLPLHQTPPPARGSNTSRRGSSGPYDTTTSLRDVGVPLNDGRQKTAETPGEAAALRRSARAVKRGRQHSP